MKRSEMIEIMMEELENVKIEEVTRLLDVMEDNGMLPPIMYLDHLGLTDNGWEEE